MILVHRDVGSVQNRYVSLPYILVAPSPPSLFLSFPLPSHLPSPASLSCLSSPSLPHSTPFFFYPSYVLLHHVMGELEGARNAWAYVEGGMGSVSMAIARAAESYGATLHTESVSQHLDLLSKVHRHIRTYFQTLFT